MNQHRWVFWIAFATSGVVVPREARADERSPLQLDRVEVRADKVEHFPFHAPPPLPAEMRAALESPDWVEVCLIEGGRHRIAAEVKLRESNAHSIGRASGHPMRSEWKWLAPEEAARVTELLLRVDEHGRRGEYACVPNPTEVFRFLHAGRVLTARMCHCMSYGHLDLDGVRHTLYIDPINVELLEIVHREFPNDERIRAELEDARR